MNLRSVVMVLLVLAAFSVDAAAVKPAWTVKGFKQPESALHVAAHKAIFVSNIDGAPDGRDGKGFISRLDESGKLVKLEWVAGLNAPKGLGYAQGLLYVADINELVVIEVKTATIVKRYAAPDSKGLNDVALEPRSNFSGQTARAYVSDFADNAIWYLGDGKFSKLLKDPALETPNGLLVEGENLLIANWGVLGATGYATEVPGRLKTMALDEEGIADRFSAIPLGNLDGLESDGKGGYWVSDWLAGKIFRVKADGTPSVWLQVEQGAADIGIVPGKWLLVPMMLNGELRAYALPK
ncbi:MAG: SMP-30/gluconolactonase/LRE family protein [Panacagrimonas sp.]